MKLSISLSAEDVEALDAYAQRTGLPSRSAAVQHAIRMLRHPTLEDDYADAWAQWSADGEDQVWDRATDDGAVNAPR
ncbi:ribbon-helix-helix domain-containing protein [Mycolicibacter senuensis]|uniref:Antitoxin MazE9 n=1 Tax=Mycolicibacter senuensis TaxID=386913 RepID=A0A7I9XN90_9MYCO|nr:ribbon-helix-helix domain-containing protein [Mycolicibacter senuensis]ORW66264.1 antitoxin [Mycolicibacter senuensis]GFG71208.1 antitoxin MazE9 [Mycolicibacter senuensis]